MIPREILPLLLQYAQSFRAVLLVGPRQTGKTTLVKQAFPGKTYVSLENPDERMLANEDPRAFLNRFPKGAILDEIQNVPRVMSYLQEILDNTQEDGLFILTGSNNILLQQQTSQTLAGRIGVLDLLPLSFAEISAWNSAQANTDLMLSGLYPEVIFKKRNPKLWYASYVRTYLERDIRQITQIQDVFLFQKFLRLLAGRIGQQLNLASISNDCGVNVRTANAWISILESTYILYLLQPFYENFNKRLVKSPKIYFYDTGLACYLLNIKSLDELVNAHFYGALFENFIISECIKNNLNRQKNESYYYWRDNNGVEIDLIQVNNNEINPIEIKSAQTYSKDFSKNLKKFMDYSGIRLGKIVFNGLQEFEGSEGVRVMNWKRLLSPE